MIYETMTRAIAGAWTGARLDDLSRAIYAAMDAMSDDHVQSLAEAIQARRVAIREGQGRGRPVGPPRRLQRPPSRPVAVARRRQLARSGVMPPAMAARFTEGELAALRIVADEVRARGFCGLVLDAIAARAGVSRTTVQNGLRAAVAAGFVTVTRRRIPGDLKNLPNVVRIVSPEWLAWLKPCGFKRLNTTDRKSLPDKKKAACAALRMGVPVSASRPGATEFPHRTDAVSVPS
jgi:hypothetical protein